MIVQLYCRRAIAVEDAFPTPMDFDYSIESVFNEQARQFVESHCASSGCSTVLLIMIILLI